MPVSTGQVSSPNGENLVGGLLSRHEDELTSRDRILRAALLCFAARGYGSTSIREIANRAGISMPGLYHHFPGKADLLETLLIGTMDDLISATRTAAASAGDDPIARFSAVVEAYVRFHCERAEESFVGNTELRSLSTKALKKVVTRRDRQQRLLEEAVTAGVDAGVFDTRWPHEATRAVATMCVGVAGWFDRSGPLAIDDVVAQHRELALNTVGYRGPPRRARSSGRAVAS